MARNCVSTKTTTCSSKSWCWGWVELPASLAHVFLATWRVAQPLLSVLVHEPGIGKFVDVVSFAFRVGVQADIFCPAKGSMPRGLVEGFRFGGGDPDDRGLASASAHFRYQGIWSTPFARSP